MKYNEAFENVQTAKTYAKDLLKEISDIEKFLTKLGKPHWYRINVSKLTRKRLLAQEKILLMEKSVSYIEEEI
jgi:hypothetical protein